MRRDPSPYRHPVTELRDPTGAGDSFAGALIGRLALKTAVILKRLKKPFFTEPVQPA